MTVRIVEFKEMLFNVPCQIYFLSAGENKCLINGMFEKISGRKGMSLSINQFDLLEFFN